MEYDPTKIVNEISVGPEPKPTRPIKELADAIRKNGWPQGEGDLFYVDDEGVFRACALGQAALNLGFATEQEARDYTFGSVYKALDDAFGGPVVSRVMDLNDRKNKTLHEIADIIEAEFDELPA